MLVAEAKRETHGDEDDPEILEKVEEVFGVTT